MKTKFNRLLLGVLAALLCASMAGCENSGQEESLVYLDYATGMSENGEYNKELYGMNHNNFQGPDPGCFYLSEEEDPVYGGYFYKYPTSFATQNNAYFSGDYYKENKITNYVALCYRSKDLYSWELCGALDRGYVCVIDAEDWCQDNFWAPEVIRNQADGKYYLYFSASIPENYGVAGLSNSTEAWDRLYLGVAVSDSPMGPFDVLYDIDAATGKRVPTINFQTGCNTEYPWATIDPNPFFDDNGDFYLYFNKHTDDHYEHLNGIWGMKMKSMSSPDYSTVSCLTHAGIKTVSNEPGNITEVKDGPEHEEQGNAVNEAPYMIKHNGKYYITYSQSGYSDIAYSVHQAVSDNPLTGFVKLDFPDGNPVIRGDLFGYTNGTGHHAFAQKGDDIYIVYHKHDALDYNKTGFARTSSADRVHFVTNSDGLEVLTASGPTKGLVWLSEDISGHENLAQKAEVQISTGSGVQYLTDGILPFYTVTQDRFMKASEDVTITFKWKEPVDVQSIMIYNSLEVNTAFSKIADVRFKLAKQPEYASKQYDYAVIKELAHPSDYWDPNKKIYISCAPAVAEFEPILVSEISITISATDRLIEASKTGELNTALKLSEIVILGGAKTNE